MIICLLGGGGQLLSFWVGAAGRGVARKVRDTGRPARANKEKMQREQRGRGAGTPAE